MENTNYSGENKSGASRSYLSYNEWINKREENKKAEQQRANSYNIRFTDLLSTYEKNKLTSDDSLVIRDNASKLLADLEKDQDLYKQIYGDYTYNDIYKRTKDIYDISDFALGQNKTPEFDAEEFKKSLGKPTKHDNDNSLLKKEDWMPSISKDGSTADQNKDIESRNELLNAQGKFNKDVAAKKEESKTVPSLPEKDKPENDKEVKSDSAPGWMSPLANKIASDENANIPEMPKPEIPKKDEAEKKTSVGKRVAGGAETAYMNVALGAADAVSSIANSLEQALGDAASGGAYSDGFKVLGEYFSAMPQEMRSDVLLNLSAEGMPKRGAYLADVSKKTGVPSNVILQYAKSAQNETMREELANSGYSQYVNPNTREKIANVSFSIGQQIPGLMLSGSLSGALPVSSGIAKIIGANPSTVLIGMSAAGNKTFELAREKGYNPSLYAEALVQGGIEMILEGAIGFSDLPSYAKRFANTGSSVGNVAKAFVRYIIGGAEEGIEEVLNVPLSNLASRAFGSDKKFGFGEGEIFDWKAMVESGLNGLTVGLIMGGVTGTALAVSGAKEGTDIRANAEWLNNMAQKLPEHYRPADTIDAATATAKDVEAYGKELTNAFKEYMTDSMNGNAVVNNKDLYGEDVASVTEDNAIVQLGDQAEVLAHVQAHDTEGAKEIIDQKIQHYTEMAAAVGNDSSLQDLGGEGTSEKIASNIAHLNETKGMIENGNYNADAAQKAIAAGLKEKIAEGKKTTDAANKFVESVKNSLGVARGERAIAHTIELLEGDVKNGVKGASQQLKVARKALASIRNAPSSAVRSLLGASEKTLGKAISDDSKKRSVQLDYSMPENSYASYNRNTGEVKVNPIAILRAQNQMDNGNKARSEFVHEAGHIAAQMDASFVSKVYDVYAQLRDSGIIPQFGEDGINENEIREAYKKDRSLTNYLNTATVKAGVKQLMEQGATLEQAQSGFVDAFLKEEVAMHFLSYAENHGAKLFDTIVPEKRNAFVQAMRKIAQFFRDIAAKIRKQDPASAKKMDSLADKLYNAVAGYAGGSTTAQERTNAKTTENTDNTKNEATEGSTGTHTEDERKSLDVASAEDEDGVYFNDNGDAVAADMGDGSTRYSLVTYREGGRDTLVQYLNKRVAGEELSSADADDIIAQMDAIYDLCEKMTVDYNPFGEWSTAVVDTDEDGNPIMSVIKPNGEYVMNLDFSLVCKKRRALDAVFKELIRRGTISDFDLGQEQIVQINDIIRKHGFEIACQGCFVEAKRFRQAKVADTFVNMYNSMVKSMAAGKDIAYFNFGRDGSLPNVENGIDTLDDSDLNMERIDAILAKGENKKVPYKIAKHLKENPSDRKLLSRGDFMSSESFENVTRENPAIMSLYNSKKGSGGPKAAFGDVQYLSDIIRSSSFNAEKAFSVGGVRVQSFSDYVARLVFDYVQMVGDLAAKALPAHAYTKEALFVKQFGLTGMKINMSLFPARGTGTSAGLNEDGSYAWADESFDYDTAIEIQNDPEYAKNCGTICVGVSDEHIRKLLADDNIRMVIPYHSSGLNPMVAKMNNIDGFKNYTKEHNTRYGNGIKLSETDLKEQPNFNDLMHSGMDAVEASREYVEWCEENGYLPKFDRFAYNADGTFNENYYKLLEDFTTMVDGKYYPQEAVKAVFPNENSAFGSMESLIREGLEEDAAVQFERDAAVGDIVDEIESVLGETVEDERYSLITSESTDTERARILSEKTIINPPTASDLTDNSEISSWEDIDRLFGKEKRAIIKKLAREFGVFKGYDNEDINLSFEFSVNNYEESYSKQKRNYKQFAKMLSVFDGVIEKAVGIEVHLRDDYKKDATLKNVYVLMSAYEDGENIVPVKLEVKEFHDKQNTLYVAVALDGIKKTEVSGQGNTENGVTQNSRSVTISITDLMRNVNPSAVNFTKYFPKELLTKKQADALDSDDIRYSKVEDLEKKIARLKEDKEFLKQQMEKSRSVALSPADVDKIVKEMRDRFGFDNSERDNVKKMLELIDKVVNKKIKSERIDEVWDSLARGARSILEGVYEVDASLVQENEAFIKHIRSTPLSVPSDNENDLPGGYGDYRNENRKYVNLSRNGTPIDSVYNEICEQFPGMLDRTIANPADMVEEIVHVMKSLEPEDVPVYSETIDQASNEFVNALIAKYLNTAQKTYAQKLRDKADEIRKDNADRRVAAEVNRVQSEADRMEKSYQRYIESINKKNERRHQQTVTAYEARLNSIENAAARDAQEYERIINRYKDIEAAREFAGDRKEYARRIRQDARAIRSAAVSPNQKKFIPEGYRKNVENIALWLDRVSVGGVNLNSDDAKWTAIAYIRDDINKVSAMFSEDFLGLANGLLNQIEDITGEAGRAYNKDLKAAIFYRDAYKLGRLMRKSIADMNKIYLLEKRVAASMVANEITETLNRRRLSQKEFESLADKGQTGKFSTNFKKVVNFAYNRNLSFTDARTFFHRMGKAGDGIYETLRSAQSRQYLYIKQYTDKVGDALDDVDLSRYAGSKQKMVNITLSNGKEFTLTAAQAMNIVTLYERAAGKSHIENGGVRIYNPATKQASKATALTEKDIVSLRNALDETDKKVMRVLSDFMRNECTAWGNEATMEKYGFHRFTTKDYFPISVDRTATGADMKSYAPAQFNVENVGFAKPTKDNASAPVMIDSMIDVANNHIRGMASYAAYLNAEDGINRIMKVPGVVDTMKRALGSEAEKYITEMMNDLKGAGKTEALANNTVDYLNKFAGRYKAAAVSYNASTVAKQPLSYLRAAAVLNEKYLIKGAVGNRKQAFDEMMKYSGIAVRKEIGYSDVGVGKTIGEQIGYTEKGTLKSGVRKFNEFGMAGAALADRVTWESIWLACKAEQLGKNASAAIDNDALMKATAKRFEEVIAQTQVVDSALDSAPVSRSDNPLVRLTYAFMSEPIKGYNLFGSALDDFFNSANKADKKRAGKHLAKVVAYTLIGWAAEAAITSAFSAIRDDDDEFVDKFSETYFGNLGQNALGILPMADPIVDAFLEVFKGYTPSNMADQTIVDVASTMVDAYKTFKDPEGKRETKWKAARDAVESVFTMIGVPVKNIVRIVNNLAKNTHHFINAYVADYKVQKFWYNPNNNTAREKNGFNSILADAYLSGDKEAFEYIYEDMRKMGLKPQQLVNSIAKDAYADDIADSEKSTLVKYTPGSEPWYIGMKTIFGRDEDAPKATEDEITRVYKVSGETSVLPKFKEGKYTVDGTSKEFEGDALDKYLDDYGKLYYEVANAMRDLAAYRNGTVEEQAWWLTKAEKYASAVAVYMQDDSYSVTTVGKWVVDYIDARPVYVAKYIVGNLKPKKE